MVLPNTKKYGNVIYELREIVATSKQRYIHKKFLSKTMSVRSQKGKNSAGKVVYGIYTAWKF